MISAPLAVVGCAWCAFLLVWFSSALFAKRTLNRPWLPWLLRVAVIVGLVLVASHAGGGAQFRALLEPWASPAIAWLGAACAALGVAFAIWARAYLGRNWGMPASVKENPELVTTGPYALVRHPIYSGMILAVAGSALTSGLWWLIVLAVTGAYFLMSARKEERLMAQTFPETYPAYKARTKMLVPFIY
jgi:protein-S-isoprenylcysteine O-methyltransferase Ste14